MNTDGTFDDSRARAKLSTIDVVNEFANFMQSFLHILELGVTTGTTALLDYI